MILIDASTNTTVIVVFSFIFPRIFSICKYIVLWTFHPIYYVQGVPQNMPLCYCIRKAYSIVSLFEVFEFHMNKGRIEYTKEVHF